jgi:rhodanese-related sulfurtransferase
VDCTDNFYTNYLIHDTCFLILKPYVYASISQFQGYCCFFKGGIGPCLRCLFPNPDPKLSPNCNENGVLGVVPGVLGTIQATEVLKWILGVGQLLENKLLIVDVLSMTFRQIQLSLNPSCSLCMEHLPLQQLYYPLKREPCLNVTNYAVSKKGMFELLKQPSVTLIDVRSVEEHKAYNLGGILIPLSQLSQRLHELNREHLIILYCQSSQRSIQALNMLIDSGFSSVKYLQGGISAVIGGQ